MSTKEIVKLTVEVVVDVEYLAEQFAALTDDGQAQFFCVAAAKLGDAVDAQARYIGRHLNTCACVTEAGRAMVLAIADEITLPVR